MDRGRVHWPCRVLFLFYVFIVFWEALKGADHMKCGIILFFI